MVAWSCLKLLAAGSWGDTLMIWSISFLLSQNHWKITLHLDTLETHNTLFRCWFCDIRRPKSNACHPAVASFTCYFNLCLDWWPSTQDGSDQHEPEIWFAVVVSQVPRCAKHCERSRVGTLYWKSYLKMAQWLQVKGGLQELMGYAVKFAARQQHLCCGVVGQCRQGLKNGTRAETLKWTLQQSILKWFFWCQYQYYNLIDCASKEPLAT